MTAKRKKSKTEDVSSDLLQGVVLTFNDGTTAVFTGRAVCMRGDTRTISRIQFTEPKPLPKGCHFDKM